MRLSENDQKEAAEFSQIRADMKAFLKQQSKNDLIKMIFEQLDLYVELRREFKALKEQKDSSNEEVSSSTTANS